MCGGGCLLCVVFVCCVSCVGCNWLYVVCLLVSLKIEGVVCCVVVARRA